MDDDIRVYGQCPVQGEGRVEGHEWYFRARGSCWSLEVEKRKDPHDDEIGQWCISGAYGTGHYEASYMPESEAIALIREGLSRFRREFLGM